MLEVGVDAQVLREKYLENRYFASYRVNTEIRVRELGWDKPPGPAGTPTQMDTDIAS